MPHDFGPKQLKMKRGDKGEDQGRFDCISLEGQTKSLHAE